MTSLKTMHGFVMWTLLCQLFRCSPPHAASRGTQTRVIRYSPEITWLCITKSDFTASLFTVFPLYYHVYAIYHHNIDTGSASLHKVLSNLFLLALIMLKAFTKPDVDCPTNLL